MSQLPAHLRRRIDEALDVSPCGRCKGAHPLKACPAGPSTSMKGQLWNDMAKAVRGHADDYLKSHSEYSFTAPTAAMKGLSVSSEPNRQGGGTARPSGSPMSHAPNSVASTRPTARPTARAPAPVAKTERDLAYNNNNKESDMYYPDHNDLSRQEQTPLDTGKAWQLPKEVQGRDKLLNVAKESQFPLRQDFFPSNPSKTVFTNHFELDVKNISTFWEYKIVGLEMKNRKKLRALVQLAIKQWSFLASNENAFATNYIDTVVSWKRLHNDSDDTIETESGKAMSIAQDKGLPLSVRFKFIKSVATHTIERYAAADPSFEKENFDDISRCLNIIISKSFSSEVHKLSSNKFFVKDARAALTNGRSNTSDSLEVIRGYFYNVKPGMGNILLNFNISTSAILRPIRLDQYFSNNNTFPPDKTELNLKSKMVYVDLKRYDADVEKQKKLNAEESRFWKFCELQHNGNIEDLIFWKKKVDGKGKFVEGSDGLFELEDNPTQVISHLAAVFGKPVVTGRPAVNVGTRANPVWYAQEHLRIAPFQPYTRPVPDAFTASMVNHASRAPDLNRAYIENEGLRKIGFTTGGTGSSFNQSDDIPIRLHPTMLRVPHMVLPFPLPTYKRKNQQDVTVPGGKSAWKWPESANLFFNTMPQNLSYAIISDPACDETSPNYYDELFRKQATRFPVVLNSMSESNLRTTLERASSQGVKLVILLLKNYNLSAYRDFKDLADRTFGIQSICLIEVLDNRKREQWWEDQMANIIMKLNLKLGGINHTVARVGEVLRNTMVLGADLIHPGPGAFPGTPSIASIVGSVDDHGGKCLGSMRLQSVHKTDREIIDADTVQSMVHERLTAWSKTHHGRLPTNIIYYRDGVSSGHYAKVRSTELSAIHAAYTSAAPSQRLKLTAVIVTKRHHTRFYPRGPDESDRWGNGNCQPGTCVDALVTSPYYQDFFLQSHSGIKGTARPTHYFVLQNEDRNLSLAQIRDLTHNLCYSYVRAMTGVSYVAPTYYADRLCERGRLYVRKYYSGDDATLAEELRRVRARAQAKDAGGVEAEVKRVVFERVASEFYRFRGKGGEARREGNPWSRSIGETMFWM